MGKSSGNQKQTVTQQTKLPAWYESGAKDAIAFANNAAENLAMPYMGNTVAGLDPLQQQAINLTGQNIGATNQAFGQAQQGALSAMGYRPQDVGTNYQAMMVNGGYSPMSVAAGQQGYNYQPERVAAGAQGYDFNPQGVSAGQQSYDYNPLNVNGGSFLSANLNEYMNPFVQNVENAALANMQQGLKQNLNTIADRSINAGAFGGSRQGVMEGTAAAEAARQFGDFSANLRNQAFDNAANLAGQDMSRGMQAQLANQQAGMSNAQFGANMGMQNIANNMQAQQFNATQGMNNAQFGANLGFQNQQQALQAALANQQAGMGNAQFGANLGTQNMDRLMQASLANQQAGLQGAQMNQQAALANQGALYNQAALNQQGQLANQSAGLQSAQMNLSGANALGNLAAAGQQNYLQSLQSALAAGQINQAQAQALLTQQQQQYDAMRNVPLEQLNIKLAGLGGVQVPMSSSQTSTTPTTGSTAGSVLGGALSGLSTGASLFGAGGALAGAGGITGGMGAAGGALLGGLAMFSDERSKTNVEPLGKDAITGLPIYAYDYKADLAKARRSGDAMPPKRVGPMAQDVEKMDPRKVGNVGGKKVIRNFGFGGM